MKKIMIFLGGLILFVSCTGQVNIDQNENFQTEEKDEVVKYVNNLFFKENIKDGRNVNSEEIPDFFYDLEYEDEVGNVLSFANLSEDEKIQFVEQWKDIYEKQIEEKIVENPELLEAIKNDNDAFESAVDNTERTLVPISNDTIIKKYIKNYNENCERQVSRGSTVDEKDINYVEFGKLKKKSIETLEKNYKKGDILYDCIGIGHTSLMYSDKFDKKWYSGGIQRATITSFPNNHKTRWTGQLDGMQFEPIEYWCGTSAGSADLVQILTVRGVSYKIKIKLGVKTDQKDKQKTISSEATYFYPSDTDRTKVVNVANSLYDKKVKYVPRNSITLYVDGYIKYKNSDKYSYCSQVVWKSWKVLGSNYDMSPAGLWVAPVDIVLSPQASTVTIYSNK